MHARSGVGVFIPDISHFQPLVCHPQKRMIQ
jgi:hypothetical protein